MKTFHLNFEQSEKFNPEDAVTGKYILRRKNGTKRVVTVNHEQSLADQSQADECDVNNIMDKYLKTGQVSHLTNMQGQYADVSQIPDLHTALSQVTQAEQAFQSLPAELRERFNNSPIKMVEFLKDSKNDQEAINLNLKSIQYKTIPVPVPDPDPAPSSINETKSKNQKPKSEPGT